MIQFFSQEECEFILFTTKNLTWEKYDQDFKYTQTFINDDHINEILSEKFKFHTNISTIDNIKTRLIKLSKEEGLPTHNFNYSNSNSVYKNTKFTIVVLINENYGGGDFYYNNNNIELNSGYGVIHDRSTKQKITKIERGDCYLLFSHISSIQPNKLI